MHSKFIRCLEREDSVKKIEEFLANFEKSKNDTRFSRGMYVYGASGVGKTYLVTNVLRDLGYDFVTFDTGEVRNKHLIETMTADNMSDKNVLSMMKKNDENSVHQKRIVVLMDEIDGLNSGDKGGINSLIKLIRHKKTKKQKNEQMTVNPVIGIGNYFSEKKIRELMKVCLVLEIKRPSAEQTRNLMNELLPLSANDSKVRDEIVLNANSDLRQLNSLIQIYQTEPLVFSSESSRYLMGPKSHLTCAKTITGELFKTKHSIDEHNILMNDTDRTIVALLFHENLLDSISNSKFHISSAFETAGRSQNQSALSAIQLYEKILSKICFADYMDRITFQHQIWQFNEMTSLIKTFHSHKIFHDHCTPSDNLNIRFTKVLTKYSTEYNNALFVQNLCQTLQLDQKDCFSFFEALRNKNFELSNRGRIAFNKNAPLFRAEVKKEEKKKKTKLDSMSVDNVFIANIEDMFESANICIGKLFIKRIYRYLDAESIVPNYNLLDTGATPNENEYEENLHIHLEIDT